MPATRLGATPTEVLNPALKQIGYEKLDDLTTAVGLTVPEHTLEALVQCDGGTVRWRADGTSPTAANGNTISDGQAMTVTGPEALGKIEFINGVSTSTLDVSYWG